MFDIDGVLDMFRSQHTTQWVMGPFSFIQFVDQPLFMSGRQIKTEENNQQK